MGAAQLVPVALIVDGGKDEDVEDEERSADGDGDAQRCGVGRQTVAATGATTPCCRKMKVALVVVTMQPGAGRRHTAQAGWLGRRCSGGETAIAAQRRQRGAGLGLEEGGPAAILVLDLGAQLLDGRDEGECLGVSEIVLHVGGGLVA